MIAVPLKVGERITGVAQVINRLDDRPFDTDDLDLFIALCSMAAIAIENARMHRILMEKQRLVKDLEFARTIQESFLPHKTPEVSGYAFSSHYTPAQEVGGDFYDFIPLERDRIGIAVGDVSGKGVPAALFMARLGSDLRTLAFTEGGAAHGRDHRLHDHGVAGRAELPGPNACSWNHRADGHGAPHLTRPAAVRPRRL